jgi:anti-sigma-K factor RskA
MNCEQFEELAAAYALGALPADEMRAAEEHLASCGRHPELRELQAVAAGLAAAAPKMEPPTALRSRLMDAVRADISAGESRGRAPAAGTGTIASIRAWLSPQRFGYALSAGLAAIVIALVVWNVSLQSDGGSSGTLTVSLSGLATGTLTYIEEQKIATMDMDGPLEAAPAGHVYQVWAIKDGRPASIGFLEAPLADEDVAAMSGIDLAGVDTVAVTIEPEGGSEQPTTDPIIAGEL